MPTPPPGGRELGCLTPQAGAQPRLNCSWATALDWRGCSPHELPPADAWPPGDHRPTTTRVHTSALTSRTRCPCSHTDHSLVSRPPCTDDTGAVVPGAHPAAPRHSGTHTRSPQVMRRPSPPSMLTTRTTAPRHWRPAGPSSAHLPPPQGGADSASVSPTGQQLQPLASASSAFPEALSCLPCQRLDLQPLHLPLSHPLPDFGPPPRPCPTGPCLLPQPTRSSLAPHTQDLGRRKASVRPGLSPGPLVCLLRRKGGTKGVLLGGPGTAVT